MESNVIEEALLYAIQAHKGQVRKNEKDKPFIIHPMAVAQILIENNADNNVIAAALLHDVWEDTDKSLDDIRQKFGDDIAHLVKCASEPDKSKTWEERKAHTIEFTKNLSLREKLIIAADKINNIESIERKFNKDKKRDFSAFKRGEKEQEWYYRNMYYSLITNQDKNLPLFIRLETAINNVFNRTMEEYIKQQNKEY